MKNQGNIRIEITEDWVSCGCQRTFLMKVCPLRVLELPSEILMKNPEVCRSLFSHLRKTFCLDFILIRLTLTSQEKRLLNRATAGFFSKHVLT